MGKLKDVVVVVCLVEPVFDMPQEFKSRLDTRMDDEEESSRYVNLSIPPSLMNGAKYTWLVALQAHHSELQPFLLEFTAFLPVFGAIIQHLWFQC